MYEECSTLKEIQIRKSDLKAIVDDDDFELLNRFAWNVTTIRGHYHYACRRVANLQILMHREILGLEYGDKKQGDHINGNTLDNRRCNLRAVSKKDNIRNRRSISGQVPYKGVHFNKQNKAFYAQIYVNWERIRLGSFSNPEDAARAYDEAAKKYHGEFAATNESIGTLEVK